MMKTNLEDISPVKKKLMIEIEAKEVDNRLEKTYREYGKKAKIRGFRPGKIPRGILENYFAEQVMEEVTREIVSETLPKAMEEAKTLPVSMPVVENETLKVNQDFKYSAVIEVRPEFELKDYMGLQVQKEICSLGNEAVDEHLEEIRETHGKLINIDEDRGVKEGDYVIIEYEGFEDEKALDGIKSHNFLLKIGSNDFHPDFEKALIGLNREDTSHVKVAFEESYYHSGLAGKSVNFRVKVIEIKEMELPELNDEFAGNLGADFDSLEGLKE
ncbi:MAG: trigger factor, partial [Deltaproteobacteria bacterium]|nr:trigger factor [Deltaproteobacteria bacterium]